jgi:hypothetical protein
MAAPYRVEEADGGLRVVIPAAEDYVVQWILGLVWSFWLFSGACLFETIERTIAQYPRSHVVGMVFSAASTFYFTPKGLRAFSVWSWSVYGEETLILGAESLSLVRSAVGARRTYSYPLGEVRNLRAVSVPHPLDIIWPLADSKKRPDRGGAAFDDAGAEVRFAEGLAPAQAEALVKLLIARRPGLAAS